MGLACGTGWTDYIISDEPEGFDFTSCCEKHDKCYQGKDGQCDKSKKQCDDDFYNCMKKKCDLKYLSYRKCYEQANKYWTAVDLLGKRPYKNAREKGPCKCKNDNKKEKK